MSIHIGQKFSPIVNREIHPLGGEQALVSRAFYLCSPLLIADISLGGALHQTYHITSKWTLAYNKMVW